MLPPLSEAYAWTASDWCVPSRLADGVTAEVLWWDERGHVAVIVHFEPGSVWPIADPWTALRGQAFIYGGSISDRCRSYERGTFIHIPAGQNRDWRSDQGAEVFALVSGMPLDALLAVNEGTAATTARTKPRPAPTLRRERPTNTTGR